MHHHRYIEFAGVAGSGKTTAAKLLVDMATQDESIVSLRERVGKRFILRVRIFISVICLFVEFPSIAELFFLTPKKIFAETPHITSTIRNLAVRLIVDVAVIRCIWHPASHSVVNDEGLIGKLASLSVLTTLEIRQVQNVCSKLLPRPTLIVHMQVPPHIAIEREAQRNLDLPFFSDMSIDLKKHFFSEVTYLYKILCIKSEQLKDVETINLDNEHSSELLAREVKKVLSVIC